MVAGVEIPINKNASAVQMAQTIFGDGVTVVSASYTGDLNGFTNNNPFQSNLSNSTTTSSSGPNNVAQFNAAAGTSTCDAAYLDVDFIPTGSLMTMKFVFSSEEYPEFANGAYQDFVGVWVNGTQVDLAVGDGDIDPNNLNAGSAQNLFIDNTADQYNTEMDGFTVTMTLTMNVVPGQVNSIRIGIADVLDSNYDSTLLIAGDSIQTTLVADADSATIYPNGTANIDVLANDVNSTGGTLTITHINGQAVSVGSTITLPSGQTVTLNADGTLTAVGDGDVETVSFTYTVASSTGQTDVGFVTLDSIPCFVAGTRIATPQGDVAVELLHPGDLVLTKDDGPQPLRWIGSRQVAASGAFAPIRIRAGTFGAHGELWLSPEHRVLIRDVLADLLFGENEVLVAAKHLVNDRSVCRVEGGEVEYVHLMFDRHQVIYSEGLETESFPPGPQTANSVERDTLAEICALFPELDPETGAGYSPAARRTLKRHEAELLKLADRQVA